MLHDLQCRGLFVTRKSQVISQSVGSGSPGSPLKSVHFTPKMKILRGKVLFFKAQGPHNVKDRTLLLLYMINALMLIINYFNASPLMYGHYKNAIFYEDLKGPYKRLNLETNMKC